MVIVNSNTENTFDGMFILQDSNNLSEAIPVATKKN